MGNTLTLYKHDTWGRGKGDHIVSPGPHRTWPWGLLFPDVVSLAAHDRVQIVSISCTKEIASVVVSLL